MTDNFGNHAMLIWEDGEIIKEQWALETDEVFLGRDASCQIKVPSRWISRIHARFYRKGTQYLIQDSGSKNGLYINGQRIYKDYALSDGDKIQLAPGLDLIFVDSEATAPLPGRAVDQLYLDHETRQVYLQGQQLSPPLSTQQYDMLSLLYESPGRVYSRYEIIEAAWPNDHADGVSDDAVDAMVRRLRQRLAEVDSEQDYIVTVRGYGFKLDLG